MPFNPATRIVSSGSPVCGTSLASIPRSVPTITTLRTPCGSRRNHSLATASAGKTWPPVPPPAISRHLALMVRPTLEVGVPGPNLWSRLVRVLADIQEHSRGHSAPNKLEPP
jgi:hypothetical protein